MLVSNKHFTPVIGLDIHIVILFGFPIPLPHPYIGLVVDPMDYIPFIGASTRINHVPRGKSDTSGKLVFLFHIPMGGPFLLAPMIGHNSVNFFGSKKVKVEGNLMSPSGHMLMTCNDIGIPLSLQPGKKFIPIPSLYLPTSYSIPLSFGKPVMVGGPFVPDWAGVLMNLIMSYGFGALMKGLGKAGKKALTKFNHALKNKLGSNKLSKALCKKGFEPVDLVQGIVIYDGADFELAGPLPLKWERSWNSDSPFKGLLGHGTHLCYDLRIQEFIAEDATVVLLGDGRSAVFEALPFPGNSDYNRHEQLLLTRTHANEYTLFDYDVRQTYTFRKLHPQDGQYRLVSIHDEAACLISFHYNAQGHLLRVIDSAGRHLHIKNDVEGRILSVTAQHRGEQRLMVSYTYNEDGDLSGITDALGKTTYIHYRDHLMLKKTDRNGNSFYWNYDKQGRCIHTTGDNGLLEGFLEYHPREGFNRITNAQGHTTTYYYTPDFVVTQIKEPMGNSIFYQYTDEMEVYREIDAEGNVTGYTYDEMGNCTTITAADGSESVSGFNDKGQLISRAEADGNSRTYTYYDNGLLHTLTDSAGHITIFRYNDKNLLSKIEDEREHLTLFHYDEDGNISSMQLPDGSESSWQYDAWGNCLQLRNPAGEQQYFRVDALGRVIGISLPDGNQVTLQYDAYDDITAVTDKHYQVRFGYTPLGSMQYREENGVKVHFLYNRDEQLTGVVNEHGESYRFTRNANGDIISETGFDGITRHFELDSNGNVLKVHRPGGKWTSFEYNASHLVTRIEHSDGTWDAYTYNGADLLIEASNQHGSIRMERDNMGRLLHEIQDDYAISSTYNSDGERISLKSSLGADTQHQWSLTGDLSTITAGTGRAQPWRAEIQHNLLGLEIARTLPGGIRSAWTYAAGSAESGTPATHTVSSGSNIKRSRHYRWDANQQLKQVIDQLHRGTRQFGYDAFSNLAWAQYENGDYDYRLPDKAGNLYRTKLRNDRKYAAGGRLQESDSARFVYDEEGNLIRKIVSTSTSPVTYEYEWYGNGLLKQVRRPDQKIVQFRYDAIGRRIEKTFNGQVTRYLWNGDTPLHEWSYPEKDRPHITIDENGEIQQSHPEPVPRETLTTWVFEGDSSILAAKIYNGHAYSVITDHLGTPCEAYDENGERVWACELDIYGNVRNLEGPKDFVPFRYQGQYEDIETGLYYNRFRYYSPQEGIYISQDPIGLGGGLAFYAYVHDPNAWVDILGLAPHGLSGQIIRGTDTIHSKNYTSGGMFTGQGAPNQQQALLTHTERKFLSDANDIVKPGDHLQMRGRLNPCRPGCQPAIRKFVMANKVTASYYATSTRRTYHWERISDKHLIQTESLRGKVKAKYKYNMETGRRTKIKCN
ncbi:RHS repeat-associated core domain-containing protein [Chitinophaga vietnamensis]|uniref:RHS repeat-associated core domain-containing protein n=1 Tax=Chitinophaga vietnamensis TaxID=2593957 RepID=UPI001178A0DF|nr:RHS repeat-associated core domain-containing protein [Chitinophaga vietnamensis]